MRQKLTLTYLGLVTGFFVLLLLNSSVWLEMRMNTAVVLPLFTMAGFIASLRWRNRVSPPLAIALQLVVLLMFLAKYGLSAEMLTRMPALYLREGFNLQAIDLHRANIALATIFVLGNFASMVNLSPAKSPDETAQKE